MWTRAELKDKAKLSVKAFYWKSVLVAFILMLITGSSGGGNGRSTSTHENGSASNFFHGGLTARWVALILGLAAVLIITIVIIGISLKIFVFNPIEVGCKKYFLDASTSLDTAELNNLTYSFKSNYLNIVKTMFLRDLSVFLWTLLFIIPGIIKAYQYRMIPYLLSQNPNLSFYQAKERSTDIMDGEKWNTFVLDLSFILWHILSACTFGIIGLLWVNPYVAYTDAELYIALTNHSARPLNSPYDDELNYNLTNK